MKARRVAVLDIGTNSVLLLAAERGDDGRFRPLAERIEITRLGRDVDRTGRLCEEGLRETLQAVRSFADLARSLGCTQVAATATSAARDAANGRELVVRAAELGVPVEIISGEDEARFSWAAVAEQFSREGEPLAVVDIGGGSSEIIVGAGKEIAFRRSLDIGAVRLTERHVRGDPPASDSLSELDRAISAALQTAPRVDAGTRLVGVAGTFTTLATLSLALDDYDAERVNGLRLSLIELERIAGRLEGLPLAKRLRLPGLSPKRADVIVAGARLALRVVAALGADEVTIGDRGLRWGYLAERFGGA